MNEFSKLVSDFFIRYLTNQKNASENTIKTYRDAVVQKQTKLKLLIFHMASFVNTLNG